MSAWSLLWAYLGSALCNEEWSRHIFFLTTCKPTPCICRDIWSFFISDLSLLSVSALHQIWVNHSRPRADTESRPMVWLGSAFCLIGLVDGKYWLLNTLRILLKTHWKYFLFNNQIERRGLPFSQTILVLSWKGEKGILHIIFRDRRMFSQYSLNFTFAMIYVHVLLQINFWFSLKSI